MRLEKEEVFQAYLNLPFLFSTSSLDIVFLTSSHLFCILTIEPAVLNRKLLLQIVSSFFVSFAGCSRGQVWDNKL